MHMPAYAGRPAGQPGMDQSPISPAVSRYQSVYISGQRGAEPWSEPSARGPGGSGRLAVGGRTARGGAPDRASRCGDRLCPSQARASRRCSSTPRRSPSPPRPRTRSNPKSSARTAPAESIRADTPALAAAGPPRHAPPRAQPVHQRAARWRGAYKGAPPQAAALCTHKAPGRARHFLASEIGARIGSRAHQRPAGLLPASSGAGRGGRARGVRERGPGGRRRGAAHAPGVKALCLPICLGTRLASPAAATRPSKPATRPARSTTSTRKGCIAPHLSSSIWSRQMSTRRVRQCACNGGGSTQGSRLGSRRDAVLQR